MRTIVAAMVAMTVAGSSASTALAWGCTAAASDGAYGYSYNWPDEQDAELRALQECDAKTTSNDCETQDCDPNE